MIVDRNTADDCHLILHRIRDGSCANAESDNICRNPASICQYGDFLPILLLHVVDRCSEFQMNALSLHPLFNLRGHLRISCQRKNMRCQI